MSETNAPSTMTKAEALATFRALVARYGLQWTPTRVPDRKTWDLMAEVQKHLTAEERCEALGLPVR